jgi:uncharacterized delta-60 repeat protein
MFKRPDRRQAGGAFRIDLLEQRVLLSGELDPTFGTGGFVQGSSIPGVFVGIAVQSDRKVITADISTGSPTNAFLLTRYDVDGSLDTTFGNAGVAQASFGSLLTESTSLLVEPNGEIVAAGNLEDSSTDSSPTAFGVALFNADGSIDTSFGSGGTVVFQGDENPSLFWQNGDLIIATPDTVRTLNANGTVASSFETGLQGVQAFGVQGDGKLLYTTTTGDPAGLNPTTSAVYRFNAAGSLDTTFGNDGMAATAQNVSIGQVLTESNGTIVLLVSTYNEVGFAGWELVALNSNGSTDTAFGSGGTEGVVPPMFTYPPVAPSATLIQQSNGELLVAISLRDNADASQYAIVERYSATGQLDTSFGDGGSATIGSNVTAEFASYVVSSVGSTAALDSAGRLLLTGGYGPVGPNIFAVETSGSDIPGPGYKMVLEAQPTDQTGESLPTVVVEIEDANGALASMDASTVTLTLSGGPAGATLDGTTTTTVMDGLATFDDVSVSAPGTGYTLTATDGNLTPVTSSSFDLQNLQLAFATQPAGGLVNTPLNPIVVNIENPNGTVDTNANSSVTLTLTGGQAAVTLTQYATADAIDGVATFSDLSVPTAGVGYTLTASDGTDAPATSSAFNQLEPQLVFVTQPFDALTTGTPGPVTVDIEDPTGNIITTDDSQVSITLAGTTAGATLTGTTQVTAVNGVGTFNDFLVSAPGKNYTLNAIDGLYSSGSSSEFTVTAPSPETATLGKVSLPAANIAGTKLNARVPVVITNTSGALHWNMTVDIYADTTTRLDGNQVLVSSTTRRESLRAGGKTAFDFAIKSLPATLASGTYHLLIEVVDPFGATSLAVANQTVAVTAAYVRPVVSVGTVLPASIAIDKSGYVWVTVTNEGNVAARGVDFTLSLSTDGVTPLAGIILDSAKSNAVILPGTSKRFRLHFKVARAVPGGTYYPYLSTSLGGVSSASVGTATFTIG